MDNKKMKYWEETLGAGLVVVGIALLYTNKLVGMLFIGFGLGFNVRPLMDKYLFKKRGKK
jgi:hypothetical protein